MDLSAARLDDDVRSHGHEIVPVVAESGLQLDITRHDLGHPDLPDLWASLHGHCLDDALVCQACDVSSGNRVLYLRERRGKREVCVRGQPTFAVRVGESDEHHALKDVICRLAEDRGLVAVQEARASSGRRVTDVVVTGGSKSVGWEIQLSDIKPHLLKRRINRAVDDDLAPSWLSMRSRSAWKTLVERAPATTTRDLSAADIQHVKDPRLVQGIKRIALEKCERSNLSHKWHRDLRCSGWHGRPVPLPPDEHPTLGAAIEATAASTLVPLQWPRPTRLYGRFWLLAPAPDVSRFVDAERPLLNRLGSSLSADYASMSAPAEHAPWHVAKPRADEPPAQGLGISRDVVESILGPRCPHCGWTRGEHRPALHWPDDVPGCPWSNLSL